MPRRSIKEALAAFNGQEIIVMIGPEGDTEEIERICRSVHGMHTENDDVFIIED